jgi:hypothetical protein
MLSSKLFREDIHPGDPGPSRRGGALGHPRVGGRWPAGAGPGPSTAAPRSPRPSRPAPPETGATSSQAGRAGWGRSGRGQRPPQAGGLREATYNTPIQTTAVYPIIGLTGLLNLVTVVDKFRPQAVEEKGSVCRPPSSPPVHRSQRTHPVVDEAACDESPTPPVVAQSAAGAPVERRRAGGGQ